MSRRLKIVFTLSILLNLLVIGLAAGHFAKRAMHGPHHHMMEHAPGLSPEGRHIVARTLQQAFKDKKEDMQKARALKKEIQTLLQQEEFDAERFEVLAEDLKTIKDNLDEKRIEVTRSLATALSNEDRKQLAVYFAKGFKGPQKSGKNLHPFIKGERGYKKPDEASSEDKPPEDEESP